MCVFSFSFYSLFSLTVVLTSPSFSIPSCTFFSFPSPPPQILYPFCIFAHVPCQLFLDYNLLYLLVQLGYHPSLPSLSISNLSSRALVAVPDIKASTGWWVAVGVYAACTAAWFFGVFCWKEVSKVMKQNGGAGKPFEIEKVYTGAVCVSFPPLFPFLPSSETLTFATRSSYNLACVRSFSIFSFLWRVRLAPFSSKSPLALGVEGTRFSDGVKETFSWYRQSAFSFFLCFLSRLC
jgi:hypothetical protein